MSSRQFKCTTDPDKFCFVCGEYVTDRSYVIDDTIKYRYKLCFGLELQDHTQPWAPKMGKVCRKCCRLLETYHTNTTGIPFTVPTQWRVTAS
jgi:hypothetical protein